MSNERASKRMKTMTSLALAVQGKFRFVVLLVHTSGRQPVNREQVPISLARRQADWLVGCLAVLWLAGHDTRVNSICRLALWARASLFWGLAATGVEFSTNRAFKRYGCARFVVRHRHRCRRPCRRCLVVVVLCCVYRRRLISRVMASCVVAHK